MNVDADARAVERRLERGYVSVFAVVLVIFTLAVHAAVWYELDSRERAAVSSLLQQGIEAVPRHGARIDEDGPNLADPRVEGVVWYARDGHRLAFEGYAPELGVPIVAGGDGVRPGVRWATAATPLGFVRAIEGREDGATTLRRADIALAFGFAIALLASAIGGRVLARRALVRTTETMRALRDFTADAAHEMRGPLAAIRSNAAASLRDDLGPSDVHRRRFTTIDATARSMSETIEDLLLIARSGRPLERELFAIDLGTIARAVVEARRSRAGDRGVDLEMSDAPPLRMYGNPPEIERIAGNLVDNALNFTPAGGSVAVRCAAERGGFALRVRDTGAGIDPADRERIFERFWRGNAARTEGSGTGLGLPIVRALAARHGGDVTLSSVPGQGSEFCVWFPGRPPISTIPQP